MIIDAFSGTKSISVVRLDFVLEQLKKEISRREKQKNLMDLINFCKYKNLYHFNLKSSQIKSSNFYFEV
ncbi:hypothetical protein GCM10023311_16560 [Flaviramulus aquimarinus]|uniref:Uncharacterized protein n=1 Tax=Flaviramulus aquimarinus TaxID=1170456 RepID=A0ABP9F3B2_9FLAO